MAKEIIPIRYQTDNLSYTGPDSGCAFASFVLGKQSHCNWHGDKCPFSKCIGVMPRSERYKLLKQYFYHSTPLQAPVKVRKSKEMESEKCLISAKRVIKS